jgi:hypothetical protein
MIDEKIAKAKALIEERERIDRIVGAVRLARPGQAWAPAQGQSAVARGEWVCK